MSWNIDAPAGGRAGWKVESTGRGVNLLACGLALWLVAGCGRPVRAVPQRVLEPAYPTVLANAARTGLGAGEVLRDELEEVWRTELGAGLHAPVIVSRGLIFASTGSRMVAALDAASGEHYWERRLDGPLPGGLVHDRSTLFVVSDSRTGRAYAMALHRGQRHWMRRVGGSQFPPLLVGDTLFLANHARQVVALRTGDGRDLWRARLGAAPRSTPVAAGGWLLVSTVQDSLYLLARGTGRIEGRVGLPATVSAAPALRGDTVVLPLHSGELLGLRVSDLAELWRVQLEAPILAAPIAAPDGNWYVLTRAAAVWRVAGDGSVAEPIVELGGAARASLALARDRLIVGRLDGTLYVIGMEGTIHWQRRYRDSIVAPATVADGAVYVPFLKGDLVKLR
jgi:outer membrane protein assembly factor BamB